MLIFGLLSISGDQPGWSMDSNPIQHPSPAKKWNAHFWIMFNFWWSARLAKGLQPHLSPLSNQKNEMLVFVLWSTSDDQLGWSMDSNPICHPSPAKKMKCSFLDYVQLLMIGRAGQWTRIPSATCLQPKNEMLIFGLHSTSDDRPSWLMDSNPICNLFPIKKMKCSFLYYVQLLVISRAGWWTRTPSTTPLQPKNEMLIFGLCSTSDDQLGWSMDLNPICHPSPAKTMKCAFLDYVQLLIVGWAGQWTWTPSTTCLQPRNEMLIFELRSTSDDRQGWSMDSKPICHPSPAKKWNACFWIMLNFWWLARLVNGLKPHLQPLSNQKNEMLIFVLCSNSGDQPSWSIDSNPICHPSPTKKMKCLLLYYVILLMISRAGQWTQSPSTTPQGKKMKC